MCCSYKDKPCQFIEFARLTKELKLITINCYTLRSAKVIVATKIFIRCKRTSIDLPKLLILNSTHTVDITVKASSWILLGISEKPIKNVIASWRASSKHQNTNLLCICVASAGQLLELLVELLELIFVVKVALVNIFLLILIPYFNKVLSIYIGISQRELLVYF